MRVLDIMALYKMNKFQKHLTEDQGWRIEIKRYSLLTEKGPGVSLTVTTESVSTWPRWDCRPILGLKLKLLIFVFLNKIK